MSGSTTSNPAGKQQLLATVQELIDGIHVAMLTTTLADGTLRSRPMETVRGEGDGELWFFTAADAPKAEEIARHPQVNVSYAQPEKNRYVSVSGQAELIRDRAQLEALWKPQFQQWVSQGLDNPQLALLRVHIETAEYWDASVGGMTPVGEHGKLA